MPLVDCLAAFADLIYMTMAGETTIFVCKNYILHAERANLCLVCSVRNESRELSLSHPVDLDDNNSSVLPPSSEAIVRRAY